MSQWEGPYESVGKSVWITTVPSMLHRSNVSGNHFVDLKSKLSIRRLNAKSPLMIHSQAKPWWFHGGTSMSSPCSRSACLIPQWNFFIHPTWRTLLSSLKTEMAIKFIIAISLAWIALNCLIKLQTKQSRCALLFGFSGRYYPALRP